MARGGVRPGAGHPGGPNKATREALERERIGQQLAPTLEEAARAGTGTTGIEVRQAAEAPRRKLAKERGEELLEIAIGCTAYYQPMTIGGQAADTPENWRAFAMWLKIADDIWSKLAHFQSPTYRAIAVSLPPGEAGAMPMAPPAELDDGSALLDGSDDSAVVRAQQDYLRLIKGGRG
jgi:hypothetical protein